MRSYKQTISALAKGQETRKRMDRSDWARRCNMPELAALDAFLGISFLGPAGGIKG